MNYTVSTLGPGTGNGWRARKPAILREEAERLARLQLQRERTSELVGHDFCDDRDGYRDLVRKTIERGRKHGDLVVTLSMNPNGPKHACSVKLNEVVLHEIVSRVDRSVRQMLCATSGHAGRIRSEHFLELKSSKVVGHYPHSHGYVVIPKDMVEAFGGALAVELAMEEEAQRVLRACMEKRGLRGQPTVDVGEVIEPVKWAQYIVKQQRDLGLYGLRVRS